MTEAIRNCKATIYSESPNMMIPKKIRHLVMPRNPEELGTAVGHVFFGITDSKGVEKVYGLHACCAMPGGENLPKEEQISIFSTKKVSGVVVDDSKEPYDDKLTFHITQEQYDKINAKVENAVKNPPGYNILTSNCVVFAYGCLKEAGLKMPPQLPIYSPHMTSLGIRVIEKASKIKKAVKATAAEITSKFSKTRKLSAKILDNLKKPPVREGQGVGTMAKGNIQQALQKMFRKRGR